MTRLRRRLPSRTSDQRGVVLYTLLNMDTYSIPDLRQARPDLYRNLAHYVQDHPPINKKGAP